MTLLTLLLLLLSRKFPLAQSSQHVSAVLELGRDQPNLVQPLALGRVRRLSARVVPDPRRLEEQCAE